MPALLLGVAVVVGAPAPAAAAAGAPPVAAVRPGGVSVHAHEVPIVDVLRALAREARIELRGRPRANHEINADFEDVPLDEALRRLLGGESFFLVYGVDGRPRSLRLLEATQEILVEAPPPAPMGIVPGPYDGANAPSLEGGRRPFPVDGRLASAMGSQTASFEELMSLAFQTDDPGLQRDALQAGLDILDAEPELRSAVMATVRTMTPQSLAGYLRRAAGPRAPMVAGALARAARGDDLRRKADAIARELRTPPSR